jgi:WhiB family transcriptional regulator, redox-sensing transcriptional regulator
MYGPGTAAVAAGTAGFEAVSAPEPVRAGQPRSIQPAGVTPTMVPAARSAELPCTDDPELFFAESPQDVETAKALCVGCAARMACLAGALERREPWGVWGGELFLRGQIVPRKRPRGRPRKADVAA